MNTFTIGQLNLIKSERNKYGIYKLNCRNIEGNLNCLQKIGRKDRERERRYSVCNSVAQWDCVVRSCLIRFRNK